MTYPTLNSALLQERGKELDMWGEEWTRKFNFLGRRYIVDWRIERGILHSENGDYVFTLNVHTNVG